MIYYAYKACDDNYPSQHKAGVELRTLLFSALGINCDIEVSENGRPYIPCADIDFSISHSKNMAVCAVIYPKSIAVPADISTIEAEGTKIGIDTEFIDPNSDMARLKKISHRYLDAEICSMDEFYTRWTHHEAFGKLCGEGIFFKADDENCIYHTFTLDQNDSRYKITICIR